MKFFGHPIHIMLIHFPTALLPMDLVLSYLFYRTGNTSFGSAAFYCLIAGVSVGMLAIITGFIDLVMIRNNKAAINAAFVHGGINTTGLLVFSIFAYKGWQIYPQVQVPAVTVLVVKLCCVLFLLIGNYLGGKLIFKHHLVIEHYEQQHTEGNQ